MPKILLFTFLINFLFIIGTPSPAWAMKDSFHSDISSDYSGSDYSEEDDYPEGTEELEGDEILSEEGDEAPHTVEDLNIADERNRENKAPSSPPAPPLQPQPSSSPGKAFVDFEPVNLDNAGQLRKELYRKRDRAKSEKNRLEREIDESKRNIKRYEESEQKPDQRTLQHLGQLERARLVQMADIHAAELKLKHIETAFQEADQTVAKGAAAVKAGRGVVPFTLPNPFQTFNPLEPQAQAQRQPQSQSQRFAGRRSGGRNDRKFSVNDEANEKLKEIIHRSWRDWYKKEYKPFMVAPQVGAGKGKYHKNPIFFDIQEKRFGITKFQKMGYSTLAAAFYCKNEKRANDWVQVYAFAKNNSGEGTIVVDPPVQCKKFFSYLCRQGACQTHLCDRREEIAAACALCRGLFGANSQNDIAARQCQKMYIDALQMGKFDRGGEVPQQSTNDIANPFAMANPFGDAPPVPSSPVRYGNSYMPATPYGQLPPSYSWSSPQPVYGGW